jgi:type I restriction enzyme, S subunit
MAATATAEQIESFRLLPGDVIITKDSETPDDIGVPTFVAEGAADLICGYHLAVIRPASGQIDGRYLYWAIKSKPVRSQLSTAATGITRFGLRTEAIKGMRVPLPPLDEQRRIAAGLDQEAARIDALAARRKGLLSLLDEKRTALLETAVSGPWPRKRLRFLAAVNERQLRADTPPDRAMRYMDISSVNGDGSLEEPRSIRFEGAPSRARRLARAGDTAISTVRTYLKAIALVDQAHSDCVWSTGFAIVSPGPELDPRFLYYVARSASFLAEIEQRSVGIGYPAVNVEDLTDISCPVPPLDEQRRIADRLDAASRGLGDLTAAIGRQVRLLEERREALITAAMAGAHAPSPEATAVAA